MNTAQAMPWWGWLFFAGFFLLLGLTGVMFVSILRQGDERRRLILLHAGSTSFSTFVGMLLLEIILGVAGSIIPGHSHRGEESAGAADDSGAGLLCFPLLL